MQTSYVSSEIRFVCCIKITLATRIFHTLMYWFNVCSQLRLVWCFKITQATRIFHTLMHWFYVYFQTTLSGCFMITLATRIFETLMYWFNVSFQVRLFCCFIITLTTRISDTLMFVSDMFQHGTSLYKYCITLRTCCWITGTETSFISSSRSFFFNLINTELGVFYFFFRNIFNFHYLQIFTNFKELFHSFLMKRSLTRVNKV